MVARERRLGGRKPEKTHVVEKVASHKTPLRGYPEVYNVVYESIS